MATVIIDNPPPGGWTDADKVPPTASKPAKRAGKPAAAKKGESKPKTPAKKKRTYTPAQTAAYRERRRQESAEAMATAVNALLTSEGWQKWVACRAKFHRYSWSNTLLIAMQRPDATHVTAYSKWLLLNRQVIGGERAIQIFAPLFRKEIEANGNERRVLYGFKLVPVFDIAQTEGEPLPEPTSEPITGDSHAGMIPLLTAYAETLGYTVTFEDFSKVSHGGYCDPLGKAIHVGSEVAPNAQVRVLIHEIAHALGVGYADYGRDKAECIVETVTYIVATSIGLDTSGESVPYVAGWGDENAAKNIETFAHVIDDVARKIENAVKPAKEAA